MKNKEEQQKEQEKAKQEHALPADSKSTYQNQSITRWKKASTSPNEDTIVKDGSVTLILFFYFSCLAGLIVAFFYSLIWLPTRFIVNLVLKIKHYILKKNQE